MTVWEILDEWLEQEILARADDVNRMILVRAKIRAATATSVANALSLSSGDSQSATCGQAVGSPCVVNVKDQFGANLSGAAVLWAISGDGATGATNDTSTTNASGNASTTPVMGTVAGTYTLTASVAGATPSSVTFTLTGTAGSAAVIEIVEGDNQTATVSNAVATAPKIRVHDGIGTGNGVSGVSVTWAIASGGGSVNSTGGTTTGSDGTAAVTSWTLGASSGTNTLTATSSGLTGSPITFTAQGLTGTATQIVSISGTVTGVTAGATAVLIAEVRDAGNNPVQGFSCTGLVTAGGGSIAATSAGTDASGADGRVSFTATMGTTVATNTFTITASGLTNSPLSYSGLTVAGAATAVRFAVQPQSNVTAGVTWTQQPSVEIVDQYNNRVLTSSASVSLSVSAGNAVLAGTTSGAATAGVKAFTGLSFSSGTGISTVRATSGSFTVDSNPIDVTPPLPDHLTISQEPSAVNVGVAISPAVTVRVEASDNTLVTGSTAQVQATIASGTGNLGGTTSVNAVNGVATFSNLTLDAADTYTLTFSSSGLTSDTSASFVVSTAATHPFEPVGAVAITAAEVDMSSLSELSGKGWTLTATNNLSFVTNTLMTRSTTAAARATYPNGWPSGTGPTNVSFAFSNATGWYHDFDFMPSSDFSGESPSGVNKIWFITGGTSASAPIYYSAQGVGSGNLAFQVRTQNCPQHSTNSNGGTSRNITTGYSLTRGVAHRIIVVVSLNTVDGSGFAQADGTCAIYCGLAGTTPTLRTSLTNVVYRGKGENGVMAALTGTDKLNHGKWNPTRGGNGGTSAPNSYSMDIGYSYASRVP